MRWTLASCLGLFLALESVAVADVALPSAVSAFFETQNKKDCEAWVALFDDDFEVQDPVGSTPVKTKKELLAGCQGNNQLFDTVSLQPVKGQGYAVPGTGGASVRWHCTNIAKVNGSSCPLDFSGIDVFTTSKNGTKITSMHGYFDPSLPTNALAPCLNPTHYGDPFRTKCLPDEEAVMVPGLGGGAYKVCSSSCKRGAKDTCPKDQPQGSKATPACALEDSSGDDFCALTCDPKGPNVCGPNASCKDIGGFAKSLTATGICSYDDGPSA